MPEMLRTSPVRSGFFVVVVVIAGTFGLFAQARQQGRTARPELFTAAQATRGAAVYARSCAGCHGATLTGGSAPPLTGPVFARSWEDPRVTLDDLFFVIRNTMPPNNTEALSQEERAAVFAHILAGNGYPAGPVALTEDLPQLRKERLEVTALDRTNRPEPPAFIAGTDGAAPASFGPDQDTLGRAEGSTDWLLHNHDYSGTRHSPLTQVDAGNASRLVPVCMFQMGEFGNFQTGPIVHRGVMYVTSPSVTVALDAATCRVKWRHTWEPKDDTLWNRNRGIAIKDGRVVRGTGDGYLLSLNAETGALLWARQVASPQDGETFTMPPTIFEDLVLLGPAGSENNMKGWVGAFRLSDGTPVWRFNTVPKAGEAGAETWKNPRQIPMGGGAVWTPFSLDAATGDLHVAVTNPAPDLPIHLRQGANLYTNSILALDVRTGRLRWYRQLVENDSHDWDVTHASPLYRATVGGTSRRLVATAGKDGMLRTMDRETRQIIFETAITTRENADVPVGLAPLHACPGILGGVEWNGPAYHPGTNLLYVPAVDWCGTFRAFEQVRHIPGKNYLGGTYQRDPVAKAQGWITAVEATSGTITWRHQSPRPIVAAVTTTAGNVLFAGELTGDFVALDARSGEVLYRFNTGGPMGGGVVTYEAGGRQYVAAASGSPSNFWVDRNPGSPTVVVFALPRP